MQFGIGKDLITPDIKMFMSGYGTRYDMYFQGIHDDLYVKALLMDDGRSKAITLSLDLLMHDYSLTLKVKEYIRQKYGIPEDNIVLSYTHTHGGAAVEGYDIGQSSLQYEVFLFQRIKSCIDRTFCNTFEGVAYYGKVEGDWNINRRRNVNGVFEMRPNFGGNKDNALNIIAIRDTEGNTKALMLNYSCHPVTVMDTFFLTAEYPGRLCQILDSWLYGNTTLFFQGAGANSRPKNTANGDFFKKCSFAEVDEMATSMARAVLSTLCSDKLERLELQLSAKQFVIPLAINVYPEEFYRKITENEENSYSFTAKNAAAFVLKNYYSIEDVVKLNAGIMKLSNKVYICFMCGEVCHEVKQKIEKLFDGKKIIFIGYGDGIGYIPDDKIIEEGGYEAEGSVVEMCMKGEFKAGIDKAILGAFEFNLNQLL